MLLEGGEGVCAALVLVQHTPQLVAGQVVAAVEVPDAVVAVVGRRQPVRVLLAGPAGAVTGPDAQRPELVEREDTIGKPGDHLLDPVQLGVLGRVGGLLPGPGALKGDVVGVQDPPHPFPADPHDPVRHLCRVGAAVPAAEVVRELADAPVRERQTQLPRASAGDLDHERFVLVGDPPGPPGAPVRLQHGQPVGVERVDHVPDRVRVSGHQPGDRRHPHPPWPRWHSAPSCPLQARYGDLARPCTLARRAGSGPRPGRRRRRRSGRQPRRGPAASRTAAAAACAAPRRFPWRGWGRMSRPR